MLQNWMKDLVMKRQARFNCVDRALRSIGERTEFHKRQAL